MGAITNTAQFGIGHRHFPGTELELLRTLGWSIRFGVIVDPDLGKSQQIHTRSITCEMGQMSG